MKRILVPLLLIVAAWPVGARDHAGEAIVGRWDLIVQGTDTPYTSWLEVTLLLSRCTL